MPAIFLTEDDVRRLVTMQDALETTEQAFRHLAAGNAENQSRGRPRTNSVMMHVLAGADRELDQLGWKIYTTTREGARFLVGIYDGEQGTLSALIEADYLGQLRTGAATGVASNYLALDEADTLGLIGTGLQARTQAWAVAGVRELKKVFVYGRDPERRKEFAATLAADLNCEVIPAPSAAEAVRSSQIVVTATTSKTPVFQGTDLKPGTHINAVGSNFLKKTELDVTCFKRADLVCCDSRDQCRLEAGDFVASLEQGILAWEDIGELADIVTGELSRPDSRSITIFKSVGLGIEDVALGSLIVQRAREQGIGQQLPF